MRKGLAWLTKPGQVVLGGQQAVQQEHDKLEGLIQSLPKGDRKELERRDQEHPPPVIPQQKPAATPEQKPWTGPVGSLRGTASPPVGGPECGRNSTDGLATLTMGLDSP